MTRSLKTTIELFLHRGWEKSAGKNETNFAAGNLPHALLDKRAIKLHQSSPTLQRCFVKISNWQQSFNSTREKYSSDKKISSASNLSKSIRIVLPITQDSLRLSIKGRLTIKPKLFFCTFDNYFLHKYVHNGSPYSHYICNVQVSLLSCLYCNYFQPFGSSCLYSKV